MLRNLLLLIILPLISLTLSAQDANTILGKMDDVIFAPQDKEAYVEITTYKKGEVDKVREAMMKEKGQDKRINK